MLPYAFFITKGLIFNFTVDNKIMDYLVLFFKTVSSLNLGRYYPLIASFSVCCLNLVFIILTVCVKPFRQIDKTPIVTFCLAVYTFCIFKACCELYFGVKLDEVCIITSIFLVGVSLIECFALSLIKSGNYYLKTHDKRLIDALIDSSVEKSNLTGELFSGNNFKRIEFFKGQPMRKKLPSDEYGINYSGIISYVNKMKTYPLSSSEKELLFNIESAVSEYSYKTLSDQDREVFSNNLGKLIKLMAKYEGA